MLFKKKKQYNIPKNAYEQPLKHRFTFVAEGNTYFNGFTVLISGNVSSKDKAYYIATESYLKKYSEEGSLKNVAVFYGDVESPDCQDKLFRAYNLFDKRK